MSAAASRHGPPITPERNRARLLLLAGAMPQPASSRVALVLAGAMCATLSVMPSSAQGQSAYARTQAKKFFKLGQAAMAKKDYKEASFQFSRAVSAVRSLTYLTEYCVASALELQGLKRPGLALSSTLDTCNRAIKASNGKPSARITKHMAIARRIQVEQKADALARNAIGRARSRYYTAAERQIRAAIKLNPKPAYYLFLCNVLATQKKYPAALASCAKAAARPGPVQAKAKALAAKVRKAAQKASSSAAPATPKAKPASAEVDRVRHAVENVLFYIKVFKSRKNPGSHGWFPMKMAYDKCIEVVKKARAAGAPASASFTAKHLQLTMASADTKGCAVALPVIAAAKGRVAAGNTAKFAPYKRALRGGKWKLFIKRKMINFRIYGRGGKELRTPLALARSSVWFEHLNTGTRRHWAMRRYKFDRRNRLVSKRRLTGRGTYPPSRAYR